MAFYNITVAYMAVHTCGGVPLSGQIVKASSQEEYPVRVLLPRPTSTPRLSPAFSAFLSGSAGHHAALVDSAEPAIAVVPCSSADSIAMAV